MKHGQHRCPPPVPGRVSLGAAVGASLALMSAAAGRSADPAQIVIGIAAAVAYLILLVELAARQPVSPTDWLVVQLLLAGNLAVAGLGAARHVAWSATAVLIASALALAALVVRLRFSCHRHD